MAHRVWIETIKLTHFRNYQTLSLGLSDRHVILTGANGAGKTNLLEALSFLSPGRGMRRARLSDVSKKDEDGSWAVNAELHGANGWAKIGTGLQPTGAQEGSRKIRIDGHSARTSDALLDHLRLLWITPAMDGLFTGPNSDRRRFLDRLVLAIDPQHGRRVAEYERALRSRNKLLDEHQSDDRWMDGLEMQMAEGAAAIVFARQELLALLNKTLAPTPDNTSLAEAAAFPHAVLSVDGDLERSLGDGTGAAASDLEDLLRSELARNRGRDRAAGHTLIGPHRTNLIVHHGPKSMPAEACSTGEQKALLTGIVLGHASLVAATTGIAPVMLLDEIAAHLDVDRRAALFDRVDDLGGQAWMTGTDAHLFEALGDRAQHCVVSDGTVRLT